MNPNDPIKLLGQHLSGEGLYELVEWNDLTLNGLSETVSESYGVESKSVKLLLNAMGTSSTVLIGATAGTVVASKAVVVDANKDISSFRNLGLVNLDAGSSGVAGSVDIFPATTSKGKTTFTASDNTGDTTTVVNTALQAGARTYTVPDAGASASFVMTEGAQTINGVKTFDSGISTTYAKNEHATIFGVAGADVVAVHYGDGRDITTVLTLTNAALVALTGIGAEATGTLIYTFPAGVHFHSVTSHSVALQGGGTVDADTPELGIGSTLASGANATLGAAGATTEDYTEGTAVANCSGTALVRGPLGATAGIHTGISLNAAADAKTVYLNAADTWAGADTLTASGTVIIKWTIL